MSRPGHDAVGRSAPVAACPADGHDELLGKISLERGKRAVSMSGQSTVEFADYGEILRRRWWLILCAVVGAVAVAVLGLQILPKTYTSVALVQVKPVGNEDGAVANGRTTSTLNLDTEAQLVTSNAVATKALSADPTGGSARDLARSVTVIVPPNTSVLSIAFAAGSPSQAQSGAQAFANAYLDHRKVSAQADLASQADAIRGQIKDLQNQLAASTRRLSSLQGNDRTLEQATHSSLVAQIQGLNSQLIPLTGNDVNPGSVITAAQLPTTPSSPNSKLFLASGLLAGLLLGCVIAFSVDRLDRRIRGRKDLHRLGLDTMTGVVTVPAIRDGGSASATSPGAEALRQLRNALLAQMPQRSGSVMVADASEPDAGSAVSVSLAVTMARSGREVVLLSANTVHCAVEQAFDHPGHPSLAEVLEGRIEVTDALHTVVGMPHLRVIPAGADGSLSSDLLQGPRIEAVIQELGHLADVVVTDVAPTSINADAQTLATVSDGVLVVATAMKTKREQVLEAVDQFEHVSARVFGSVVARVDRERRNRQPMVNGTAEEGAAPSSPPDSDEAAPNHRTAVLAGRA